MSGRPLNDGFAPTRWSLVGRARGDSPEARAALAELCEAYWRPVFQVLRRSGRDEDAARDLAQAFFAHLLEGGRLDRAEAGRGRFRAYLLGALRHFESDVRERERRLKRGGGVVPQSLDALEAVGTSVASWADACFDREWALTVIARALSGVEADYHGAGNAALFAAVRPALVGGDLPAQAELARALGMTEGALKVAIHRLRRRFREAVRSELAQTLPEDADPEEERRYLVEVLSREG